MRTYDPQDLLDAAIARYIMSGTNPRLGLGDIARDAGFPAGLQSEETVYSRLREIDPSDDPVRRYDWAREMTGTALPPTFSRSAMDGRITVRLRVHRTSPTSSYATLSHGGRVVAETDVYADAGATAEQRARAKASRMGWTVA